MRSSDTYTRILKIGIVELAGLLRESIMFETEVNTSYALDLALSTSGTCWLGLVTKQKQATDQQG